MTVEKNLVELIDLFLSLDPAKRRRAHEIVYGLLTRDPLTGLLNRAGLDSKFELETSRASRYSRDLSVLMVDLDNFKQYNDTYGHIQGDEALKHIARLLSRQRRTEDIVARFGGEEFLILLPETNIDGAVRIAENILERTNHKKLERYLGFEEQRKQNYTKGKSFRELMVSIGIASFQDTGPHSYTLLSDADAALYIAKKAGKNRFAVYQGNGIIPPNPSN